jgi:Sulfatase-modifying factor enzyme 1
MPAPVALVAAPIGPLSASPALPAQGSVGSPSGRHMANTWQGEFPQTNLASDSYERSSPVDAFPPNGFGLLDMIGNVSIAAS